MSFKLFKVPMVSRRESEGGSQGSTIDYKWKWILQVHHDVESISIVEQFHQTHNVWVVDSMEKLKLITLK